ncbi:hypothetical protein BC829DRAFT_417503 [Chytridium lagenaria]|nr:hypothetical protein BC829DRAFT_417503 [Chytridium lagenaria]
MDEGKATPAKVAVDGSVSGIVKFVKNDAKALRPQGNAGGNQQRTVFKTILDSPFSYKCMIEPLGRKRRRREELMHQELQKMEIEKTLDIKAKKKPNCKRHWRDGFGCKDEAGEEAEKAQRRSLDVSKSLAEAKIAEAEMKEGGNSSEVDASLLNNAILGVNGVSKALESAVGLKPENRLKLVFICKDDANPSHLFSHLPTLAFFAGKDILICPLHAGSEAKISEALCIKRTIAIGIKDEYPEYAQLRAFVEGAVQPPSLPWLRAETFVQPSGYIQSRLKTLITIPGFSSGGGRGDEVDEEGATETIKIGVERGEVLSRSPFSDDQKAVEAKPSVENALQGDILDFEKLKKLCLWVRIPHFYRPLVWKILLKVIPRTKEVWPFHEAQRREQYEELRRSTTKYNGEMTPRDMVNMTLIEEGLTWRQRRNMSVEDLEDLEIVAESILEICDEDDMDAFWLFRNFASHFAFKPSTEVASQKHNNGQALIKLLEKHEPVILKHFLTIGVDVESAFSRWFNIHFAGMLPPHSLEGIWDIHIAGATEIIRSSKLYSCSEEMDNGAAVIGQPLHLPRKASTAIDLWEKPILESMTESSRRTLGIET